MTPSERSKQFLEGGFLQSSNLRGALIALISAAENDILEHCAGLALAIDSGRGNEKMIADSIRKSRHLCL